MFCIFQKPLPKSEHTEKLLVNIRKAAEGYKGNDVIKDLSFSKFQEFSKNGNRIGYEDEYVEHRRRLNVFAVLCINGEGYIKELEDILWAICNEFTWSLPAHLINVSVKDSPTFIDLFSAETSFMLAEILSMTEDVLDPYIVERVRYELKRRIVEPYLNGKIKLNFTANWAAVCTAGVGAAVLYICERKEAEAVIPKLIKSINVFLDSYLNDGCCGEGPIYWEYGFGNYCYFADLLYNYSDGKINLLEGEKIRNIALYRQKITLSGQYVIPFADTTHDKRWHIGLSHFLADKFNDVIPCEEEYEELFDTDYRYRFPVLIRDFYWYNNKPSAKKYKNSMYCFEDSMQYIFRNEKFVLAVKGGTNDEPHNHNDLGSFILYTQDGFVLDDPGWSDYDDKYFTEKRYDNICASSHGHSIPIINGKEQITGEKAKTVVVDYSDNFVEMDLSAAYETECIRKFYIENESVKIVDTFGENNNEIIERLVTRIKPDICNGRLMIGKTEIKVEGAEFIGVQSKEFKPRTNIFETEMKETETLYLIDFKVSKHENTVKFYLKLM